MSAQFDLVAADNQTVTAFLATSAGASVTIYDDAGCTDPVNEASVSAYQSTETSRRFYVATPGTYTLTVSDGETVIYTGTVALSAAQTVCGPYRSAPPAANVIDGGTP